MNLTVFMEKVRNDSRFSSKFSLKTQHLVILCCQCDFEIFYVILQFSIWFCNFSMWFWTFLCDFELFYVILNFSMWFWNFYVILKFSMWFSKSGLVNQKSESVTVMWFSQKLTCDLNMDRYVTIIKWKRLEYSHLSEWIVRCEFPSSKAKDVILELILNTTWSIGFIRI